MASSLEAQSKSGEMTEETQWQCRGALVYDGWGQEGAMGEGAAGELAGMKSLRQGRVHRQK